MQSVMVVGASGVLGQFVLKELMRKNKDKKIIVTDYQTERGEQTARLIPGAEFRHVDVRNRTSIHHALAGVAAVIVAAKQEEPLVQEVCMETGTICVDVTTDFGFVQQVLKLDVNHTTSVVMAGFIPGLSGLIVNEASQMFEHIEDIHVALLQSTNAKAGAAGVSDMLEIITHSVDGQTGFKEKRKELFGSPEFKRDIRKIAHPERKILSEKLMIDDLHYWTAWNEESFNRKIVVLKKLGLLNWLGKQKRLLAKIVKHDPRQKEEAYLTVEASGMVGNERQVSSWRVRVQSDYETTAMMVVALAELAYSKESQGVCWPFELTTMTEVMETIDSDRISLHDR